MAIHFDSERRTWVLELADSFYAFAAHRDGQVVHVGSGPLPRERGPATVDALARGWGAYEDPDYVWERQSRRYELPTFGDVSYHDVALKVSFPAPAGPLNDGDAPHLPVRDLRLRYVTHSIRTDAAPGFSAAHGQPTRQTRPRETLCVRLKDVGYEFFVTLCYRLTPECDVVERWVELHNRTDADVAVESLAFATVHLPHGRYELTHAAGTWAREFVTERRPLVQGEIVLDQRGLNTGHAGNPFYLLNEVGKASEESGTVFFGALAYSGNWSLRFDTLPTAAVRVHGGYEPNDFAMTLKPGDRHATPAFVHGSCDDGFGGASRRMHRFVRDHVLPDHKPGGFRPVLYNGWEATYFDLSEQNQMELARKAAAIGVELYCVDDGWFGARRHDRAGLGDWVVSKDVFPRGLKPLAEEVRKLGMTFGLWIEPEMVNPDSDLCRAHPDWPLHFPGRPRTEFRQQLVLDFGRPEVVEHIFRALDRLVAENGVEFIKWDMNRYATEPGSVAGRAIWRRHVEGVYSIMDRLRARHGRLDIQSCSGGGGRIDLGVLQRADQVWTSDNTDAFDRTFIEDGFSLIYPARVMESWVTHEKNHQTGRLTSLDLRFDVAMRGALGIGTPLNRMGEEELGTYKRKLAFYKRIRPVVQGGDLYRLATAGDGGVSVWQTVLPDRSESVYSIVVVNQFQGIHFTPARLRGLDAGGTYVVTDERGEEIGRYAGIQLMTLGMPGDTAGGGGGKATRSRTVLLRRAD